jgi:site-specific recombinase XerD
VRTNVLLSGKSESTLNNYTKTTAKLSLHFGCTPLELTDAQINDYLLMLRDNSYENNAPSLSYFKHTVYGLRYLFRLVGREDKAIRLPSIKKIKELPSVLSREECRRLLRVPKLLKHRVLLSLIYSTGLRCAEARALELRDIDFDRMQIHIRQGKGKKDRYVPLAEKMVRGLKKYYEACRPVKYVFNGHALGSPMSQRGMQWAIQEAVKKAEIIKRVHLHTLRHSYATHLVEDGLDVYTIQHLLGHENIQSTLIYLHVAHKVEKIAHSPFDTLYPKKEKKEEQKTDKNSPS